MDYAISCLHSLAPVVASWWWHPRCPDCICSLQNACAVSDRVLDLLGRQLDRCGPERLAAAPPRSPGGLWTILVVAFWAFALGAAAGAAGAWWLLVGRTARRVIAPVASVKVGGAPAVADGPVVSTPGTRK